MLRSRSKKMALPPCNPDFPVCLHRIEIEKKLGSIENALILKNGLTVEEQMVRNYLLEKGKAQETTDISYVDFRQCAVGREEHICHLNEQESHSKVDLRGHTFEREVTHRIELIDSDEEDSLDQSV